MHRPLRVTALAAALIGCSHQAPLRQLTALTGKTVYVVPADGDDEDELEGVVHATPQGMFVRTERGDIPLAGAKRVVALDRGRGALEGLGLGTLVGVVTGAVLGFASGDDECDGDFCLFELSATDKAVLGGVALGGAAGLLGLLIGAGMGSRDVYELQGVPRILPSGPPGSVLGATVRF